MKHNYARPITLMQPERLVFPPGWVGHIPFAFWIVEAVRPRLFVELGTHTGNSFGAFVQAASALSLESRFFAVDHWRGDEHAGDYDEDTYDEVRRYFESKYSNIAELMRMNFDDAVANFEDGSLDLLHIDGFHTYEAVKHDFETWLPKMSERGVVLLHDTNVRKNDFGVFRLMKELSGHYPTFEFVHSNGLGIVQTGRKATNAVKRLIGSKADDNGILARDYFSRIGNALVGQAFTEILLGEPLHDKPFEAGLADIMWRKQETEKENEHLRAVRAHLMAEKGRFVDENGRLNTELRKQIAETDRLAAERGRLASENARRADELERQIAEKDRLASEEDRLSKENARRADELGKQIAEKDRLASEGDRLSKEKARLAKELAVHIAEKDRLADANERLAAEEARLRIEKDRLAAETRSQEYLLTLAGDCLAERQSPSEQSRQADEGGHRPARRSKGAEALSSFDRDYYLRHNPDVAEAGIDPLVHYLVSGRREGRLPKAPPGGEDEPTAPKIAAVAEK